MMRTRSSGRGPRGRLGATALLVVAIAIWLGGCARGNTVGSDDSAVTDTPTASDASGDAASGTSASAAVQESAGAPGTSAPAETPSAATAPVANPLFSLVPGRQSVREGFKNIGHRRLDHRRVYTITDVHKVVDGVTVTVGIDQDFDGGELSQQSLELLALDADGNIRYMGSYTEAYEGGQFVNFTDAWLSGVKGGRGGVLVPGHPRVGVKFTQAVVPGEGTATAVVTKIADHKCVPFRCFNDLVAINENGGELKYYAPGVGGVLTEPLAGDAQETEELINVTTLSPAGLAEISNEVVKLDQHARSVAADVYGSSDPAKRTS
jgi:hypothetical protein